MADWPAARQAELHLALGGESESEKGGLVLVAVAPFVSQLAARSSPLASRPLAGSSRPHPLSVSRSPGELADPDRDPDQSSHRSLSSGLRRTIREWTNNRMARERARLDHNRQLRHLPSGSLCSRPRSCSPTRSYSHSLLAAAANAANAARPIGPPAARQKGANKSMAEQPAAH